MPSGRGDADPSGPGGRARRPARASSGCADTSGRAGAVDQATTVAYGWPRVRPCRTLRRPGRAYPANRPAANRSRPLRSSSPTRAATCGDIRWRCTSQSGRSADRRPARAPAGRPEALAPRAEPVHAVPPVEPRALASAISARTARSSPEAVRPAIASRRAPHGRAAASVGERPQPVPGDRQHAARRVRPQAERATSTAVSPLPRHRRRPLRQPGERIAGPRIGHIAGWPSSSADTVPACRLAPAPTASTTWPAQVRPAGPSSIDQPPPLRRSEVDVARM